MIYGDSGYQGIENREEIKTDAQKSKIDYRINGRRSKVNKLPEGVARAVEREREKRKSSVSSKVEHPFRIVKVLFGYTELISVSLTKRPTPETKKM